MKQKVHFTLRGDQPVAVEKGLEVLRAKSKKSLLVAPTGYGKSLVIAKIVKELNEPIIILQPSKELLKQNYTKFLSFGGEATLYCASLKEYIRGGEDYCTINGEKKRCKELSKVIYATIGSIIKKADSIKNLGIKKIILDEAHLATKEGSQFRAFIKAIRATNVLGLTATPVYLQNSLEGAKINMINRSKSTIFRNFCHITQIKEVVDQGFWTPLKYVPKHVDDSFLELNTSGTDYTLESQREFYTGNDLRNRIKREVKNCLDQGRKRIAVFLSTINEAVELQKMIPNSAVVHSKTKNEDRDKSIEDFATGKIKVIVNVNILGIGYDNPILDTIINGRPTNSIAVYYQMLGRAVRLHKGKKESLIIDYSNNCYKFGPIENITFEKIPYYGWGMFNGKDELLSGYPLQLEERPTKQSLIKKYGYRSENVDPEFYFGKYKNKKLSQVVKDPEGRRYCTWLINNKDWEWYGEKGELLKRGIKKEFALA